VCFVFCVVRCVLCVPGVASCVLSVVCCVCVVCCCVCCEKVTVIIRYILLHDCGTGMLTQINVQRMVSESE
jgi:hypothetical protein